MSEYPGPLTVSHETLLKKYSDSEYLKYLDLQAEAVIGQLAQAAKERPAGKNLVTIIKQELLGAYHAGRQEGRCDEEE
jgi:hypothetical protein